MAYVGRVQELLLNNKMARAFVAPDKGPLGSDFKGLVYHRGKWDHLLRFALQGVYQRQKNILVVEDKRWANARERDLAALVNEEQAATRQALWWKLKKQLLEGADEKAPMVALRRDVGSCAMEGDLKVPQLLLYGNEMVWRSAYFLTDRPRVEGGSTPT